MILKLLNLLQEKKMNLDILETTKESFIISFNVWAKPGASLEKTFISSDGVLVIQTRARPIDGQANAGIIEVISDIFGIPKSQIEIIRGEKSRTKRIKIQLIFTANKKYSFFEQKLILIEGP